MPNMNEIGTTATKIICDGVTTQIKYHNTVVVEFTDTYSILDSGGWRTATTKVRMNQAARKYDLGYSVHQIRGMWYVYEIYSDVPIPFEDGMKIMNRR